MSKTFQLFTVLIVGGLLFFACRTAEVITIPNAHHVAGPVIVSPVPTDVVPVTPTVPVVAPPDVRQEAFTVVDQGAALQRYHVVVGSFRIENNARGLQTTLNNEGNNVVIVQNEQGMFRVLLSTHQVVGDARARASQVRNRFPDVWILMQREN